MVVQLDTRTIVVPTRRSGLSVPVDPFHDTESLARRTVGQAGQGGPGGNALSLFTRFYAPAREKRTSSLGMNGSRAAWLAAVILPFAAVACAHDLVEEVDRIVELIQLRPGMQIADVGAGDGRYSEELARRVGETGHVYATEVDEDELKKIRRRIKKSELNNMSLVEGGSDDTRLPETCCDTILLRYVYHHLSNPDDMRSSLRRSLRPGGLLVIIERSDPGHGIPLDDLVAEMGGSGFEEVSRHPEWGGHGDDYGAVFRAVDSWPVLPKSLGPGN